jgi:cholesterol transport system auxiliary component
MKPMFPLLVLLSLASGGCALTSKASALDVRWFDPETVKPRLTSTAPDAARVEREIELGRITSGINLREKIAYRDAAFEVGYYDDKRWTERPEVYVRRQLARTLYEERGMRRGLGGPAPVLDIELLSFEELRGTSRSARIQLRMLVHDDRGVLLEKTITVDRPVSSEAKEFEGLVQAMASALDAVADQVADEAQNALAKTPPAQPVK